MYKSERVLRQELGDYLYAHFGVEYLNGPDPLIENAISAIMTMFEEIPNNWAKVDGRWVEIPDKHFVDFDDEGWYIEHSLPCRIRGLNHCPMNRIVRTDWFDRRGRYEVNPDGSLTEVE